MKFSTLISSHNKGQWIERSIRSAADQSHPPHEITVCENVSTDGSRDTLRKIAHSVSQYLAFTVIEYEDFVADWMPTYLSHSSPLIGDYIHLLAADDYIEHGFYAAAAKTIHLCPTPPGVILSNVKSFSRDGLGHGQSHYELMPGYHSQDDNLHRFCSTTDGEPSRFFPGGTGVLLHRDTLAWLRDNRACRLGPWFDSVGYPAAMWAFGVYYLASVYGVFTLDQSNYGGDQRPAEQRRKERPGAEAFFAEPNVLSRLGEELTERLLARVK